MAALYQYFLVPGLLRQYRSERDRWYRSLRGAELCAASGHPRPIDYVIVSVPRQVAPMVLRDCIAKELLARIDYVAVCDPDTLREVEQLSGTVLVALAVYIGKTRLIDNAILSVGD